MQTSTGEEQEVAQEVQASRRVEFLVAPKWERVAPCQWRAVQHRGISESSLDLSVRLEEHAYRWDVLDGKHTVASVSANTRSAAPVRCASPQTGPQRFGQPRRGPLSQDSRPPSASRSCPSTGRSFPTRWATGTAYETRRISVAARKRSQAPCLWR